eukprot:scaffold5793_cov417-Prasinococcus_capsulatus_cf.AAC.2
MPQVTNGRHQRCIRGWGNTPLSLGRVGLENTVSRLGTSRRALRQPPLSAARMARAHALTRLTTTPGELWSIRPVGTGSSASVRACDGHAYLFRHEL